eukprot:1455958-Amphidinium_carterae.3
MKKRGAKGIGGEARWLGSYLVPVGIGGCAGLMSLDVLDGDIPMLISVNFLEGAGLSDLTLSLDLTERVCAWTRLDTVSDLKILDSGHLAIDVLAFPKDGKWNMPHEVSERFGIYPESVAKGTMVFLQSIGSEDMQQTGVGKAEAQSNVRQASSGTHQRKCGTSELGRSSGVGGLDHRSATCAVMASHGVEIGSRHSPCAEDEGGQSVDSTNNVAYDAQRSVSRVRSNCIGSARATTIPGSGQRDYGEEATCLNRENQGHQCSALSAPPAHVTNQSEWQNQVVDVQGMRVQMGQAGVSPGCAISNGPCRIRETSKCSLSGGAAHISDLGHQDIGNGGRLRPSTQTTGDVGQSHNKRKAVATEKTWIVTLGLFTAQGIGITKATAENPRLVTLVHRLARSLKYTSVAVNVLPTGSRLEAHTDRRNFGNGMNYVLQWGEYHGGVLWEGKQKFKDKGCWIQLNPHATHGVTTVTIRVRFSIVLFTTGSLEKVSESLWSMLRACGFPKCPASWKVLDSSPRQIWHETCASGIWLCCQECERERLEAIIEAWDLGYVRATPDTNEPHLPSHLHVSSFSSYEPLVGVLDL